MVQRKAADKLGIKPDTKACIKSENPEAKSKGGPELKKIMKKSRLIKRSDFDTLQVSSAMRQGAKARIAAPPAPHVLVPVVTPHKPSSTMVTPHKAPRIKIPETSPNYMKSTSCSTARKEHREVSPGSSKTSCHSKSPSMKDSNASKLSSASGHKSGRTLTKTPSLRPVRTLTKTSGSKAGRTSMKKNSGVVLYADQNVRKDTCSSTLKDSKFPPYVALQPGGTESEGFSVMKVCPYTYCSLNGHHHAQLPPLKSFLSAKRQALKTQKSMRLKSLSPVSRKPSKIPKKDIDTGQMVLKDPAESMISPSINEESLDFFVEIYTPCSEDNTESMGRKTDDGKNGAEKGGYGDPWGLENTSYSAKDGDEVEVGNEDGQYAESQPDDAASSAISFEDNINGDTDFFMEDMDASMFFLEYNQKEEIEDIDSLPFNTHAESCLELFLTGYESGESEIDELTSDADGMDWEEGEVADTCLDNKVDEKQEPLLCLKGFEEAEQHGELIFIPGDIVSNFDKKAIADEELQFVHGEIEYLDEQFEDVDRYLEIVLSSIMNTEESSENVFEKSTEISEENNVENEKDELITIGASSEAIEHEQEDKSSGPGADTVLCLHEPEHNEISEPVDLETENGVDSSEDFSLGNVFPVPHVNVDDGAKEAEDNEDQAEVKEWNNHSSTFSDDCSEGYNLKSVEKSSDGVAEMEVEDVTKATKKRTKDEYSSNQECPDDCVKLNKHTRCKKKTEDSEEQWEFNPRGPRFLPLEPEPNPETVDLRHQMMDERKNSEEWMVDYALRRAVNKLAPARKRKVALLVEAFETVLPLPKYEIHLPHTPTGFAQSRYMQACN